MSTNARQLKYYGVDRGNPINDSNYAILSSHSVKTVVVDMNINSSTDWNNAVTLASKYNFNIVIWPNQGGDYPNCGWETPFSNPKDGDYIWRVKPMLDAIGNNPRVVGIVTAHEPEWNNSACLDSISDMTTVKSQIKNYISSKFGRTDFKIWNYIDNISDLKIMANYSGLSDINKIMDVAVIWEHCFGNAEGTCQEAQQKIVNDRKMITDAGLEGKVELVFLFQTFAYGSGYRMPTSSEMYNWSLNFLNTGALDGFMYYTWGACWYTSDLYCPTSTKPNQELWPLMNSIYSDYVNKSSSPIPTPKPTLKPTTIPTKLPTPRPTSTIVLTPSPTTQTIKIIDIMSIYYKLRTSWFEKPRLSINIKVVDYVNKKPISMAKVYYTIKNVASGKVWNVSGYTNYNGIESYTIPNAPKGCYVVSVSNVTANLTWSWNNNVPSNEYCY